LSCHADRKGSRGSIRKSNRTDNESVKMATAKGVLQGYTGVAAVDARHQVIVEAICQAAYDNPYGASSVRTNLPLRS
jgi:hypothetical protein